MDKKILDYKSAIKEVIEKIMDRRIIQSVIGDDFYKNTMGLFISHHGYNEIITGWRFKNRTSKVELSKFLNEKEIQNEYEHFRNLSLTSEEESFLRAIPHFGDKPGIDEYINVLKTERMPDVNINLSEVQPSITWAGKWIPSSRLEIPTLQIIIGLYYRKLLLGMTATEREKIFEDGLKKLFEDIEILKKNPTTKFVNFGNRRVLLPWLELVSKILVQEVPDQLLGISNVQEAMKNRVSPTGTIAHEPSMVFAGLAFDDTEESIKNSQIKLLTQWADFYGTEMSVILPDTYGTHNMIKWLPVELVARHKGGRIDSKDPMIGIPEIHNWFKKSGCEDFTKVAIPSDGISIWDAVGFQKRFGSRGLIINAPGTMLSSNLDLPHLSIVAKIDTADGIPCVKLSDNIEKAIGEPEMVQRYKKALRYHENYHKTQVV